MNSANKLIIHGRHFLIKFIVAKNGCFMVVSEGEELKLGSTAISVKLNGKANSISLIPSKFGDLYSKILAETISVITKGIAVVSLYIKAPIDPDITKDLLISIKDMVKNE